MNAVKQSLRESGYAQRYVWIRSLIVLAVLVYGCGFCLEFLVDSLGRSPVLDGRENLAWAELIAAGQVPVEPLYRALLYPWVLSFFPQGSLWLVSFFGLLCHFMNGFLVGCLAERLWKSRLAAWVAGLLYAAYPVALYFSVQVLDLTFALSLFLGSVVLFLRSGAAQVRWRALFLAILCGVLGGLAVLARPNFLPAVLLLPLLPILQVYVSRQPTGRACGSACLIGGALLLTLIGQGAWNLRQSGEFRILPWQGAYNLYAANREGANGKFYKQRVAFDQVPAGMNTTRMESEYLYRKALGPDAELDVGAMSSYWRAQLFREIADDPVRWIGLMGKKVVYLFNDWEQYNNLTYAYHKDRFLLLQWNPLGWGMLLLCGVFCGLLGYSKARRGVFLSLGLLGLAYAAGVLIFFASARFRLPLVPLLAVLCGGWTVLPWREWYQSRRRAWMLVGAGCLLGAVCVYSNFFDARDDASFIQDELLLASASAKLGEDAEALRYAEAVLVRDPARAEAKRIQVVSLFNLWMNLFLQGNREASVVLWRDLELADMGEIPEGGAILFIRGVIAWRQGDLSSARLLWRRGVVEFGSRSSAEALNLVGPSGQGQDPSYEGGSSMKQILFFNEI
ncbi:MULTISPECIES: glycosyltransferase family 39 protein [unclassified Lentimonas]|uniref:glycosyltransferase family 39 protein n=1 Tax=unclassified Lentimonas TaxID=2630993 RepID=UPI001328CE57|nr:MULTISPECIES: glycosyltransferase family 39 protein [unclassified Lentimonas]CAA6676527.1 Unannotated [Lentimonas sp. CC4]CAA6685367.1 Unannotated [Lentimonas sp. CC6]CAA7074909.1 Unannotated [Lentimonas sp. CC4]CAA7169534.1 Unannotated [Lentimonas sp. CC21]CAA7182703.1 Unannotated [Lentimonas sp. CC8]